MCSGNVTVGWLEKVYFSLMKAFISQLDLLSLDYSYLQSGRWIQCHLGILGLGGTLKRYLFLLSYSKHKTNPVCEVELHFFFLKLYHRDVAWIEGDKYRISAGGLFNTKKSPIMVFHS